MMTRETDLEKRSPQYRQILASLKDQDLTSTEILRRFFYSKKTKLKDTHIGNYFERVPNSYKWWRVK